MRAPLTPEEISKKLEALMPLKEGFDLISDHVVITDENANILYANKAAEEHTGYPRTELVGKNPGDLWGGNMPKEFYETMWRTIKIEKKPYVGEVQNKRKDGTLYWQEVHISPVLDEKGEVKFFIGIEPNITDRKTKDQFREEFVGAVGHQLRNPLAAIQWVLEVLLRKGALKEEDREKLELVYRENKMLADIVKDLLLLARMEKGVLLPELLRFEEEIPKIIAAAKEKQPNVQFMFKSAPDHVEITTIRSLAVQVFSNIIYNASEYADEKAGTVTIAVAKSPKGITVSCHNNGAPIPPELQPKIFSKMPSGKGAGLGLYIVKMIADYLGWMVSFETGMSGTTFTVDMPASA